MVIKMPDSFKKYGGVLTKGIIAEMAPEIARGALIEMLRKRKINVQKAAEWVEGNVTLWDILGENYQADLRGVVGRIGNIDWLTPEWVIGAIRQDFPAVASLFLGWKKASNWLSRQIEVIKKETSQ